MVCRVFVKKQATHFLRLSIEQSTEMNGLPYALCLEMRHLLATPVELGLNKLQKLVELQCCSIEEMYGKHYQFIINVPLFAVSCANTVHAAFLPSQGLRRSRDEHINLTEFDHNCGSPILHKEDLFSGNLILQRVQDKAL